MLRLLKSNITINSTALFLGAIFFTAGMAKLYSEHAFPGLIGPVWLEDKLAPHGLRFYARFIAYSQVIIGFALLTLRFRTLGAVMSVPLILNILMVTISQNWQGTPYVLAVFLAMNIYLLIMDRKTLLPLVGYPATFEIKPHSLKGNLIWASGLMIVLVSIQISFFQLQLAWSVSAVGLGLSFYSNKVKTTQKIITS